MQTSAVAPATGRIGLALLVVAFLVSRGAWIAFHPETAFYWEEMYRWVVAHELLEGAVQPLLDYQADHYQGGSLVVALLAVPSFALFGESVVSFKLTAVLLSTLALLLLVLTARRWFGPEAGLVAGLGYLAGPPLVAFWGLIPFGSHEEAALFNVAQLWVFWGLLEENGRSGRRWLCFGLLAGLGFWWSPTSLLGVAACGASWLLLMGLPRPRELAAAAGGALLGLLPWFAYNVPRDFVALTRVFELLGVGDPINLWPEQGGAEKLWRLLVHDFPVGLAAPFETAASPGVVVALGAAFAAALYSAFGSIALRAACALRQRLAGEALDPLARRLVVFPVYAALFLAGYLASDFVVEPHQGAVTYRFFLAPAILSLLAGAAVAGAAWRRGGRIRGAAALLAGVYLTASLTGSWLLATRAPEGATLMTLESGYLLRGVLLHRKYEGDVDTALEFASRIRVAPLNSATVTGLGWGVLYRFEKSGSPQEIRQLLQRVPPRERARMLSGIQTMLAIRFAQLDERFARGEARDIDHHVHSQLTKLQGVADAESAAIPAQHWPLGGYRPPSALKAPAATPKERGLAVYQFLGCAGCHEVAARPGQIVRPLEGLSERHTTESLVRLIADPPAPMPRFQMSDDERRDLAAFLLTRFP